MSIDDLRKALGGREPPAALAKLAAHEDEVGTFVVCDFELTDTGQEALADNLNPEVAAKFAMFATDKSGSLYGFWLHARDSLEGAPIVYFSSEWEGTTVLANSPEEFLSLLALGKNQVGEVRTWDASAECDDAPQFREWLKRELGIDPPSDPRAVVDAARAAHPDLQAWIDEQMGQTA